MKSEFFKKIFHDTRSYLKNLTPKQIGNIIVFSILGFILINSMLNSEMSMYVANSFKQILYFVLGDHGGWWRDFIFYNIRKIAHFIEYLIFGILVSKYYLFKKRNINRLINSVYIVLSIAFIDETIQIISGREALVSDIWLDLSGGVVGVLVYLIFKYHKYIKNNRNKY